MDSTIKEGSTRIFEISPPGCLLEFVVVVNEAVKRHTESNDTGVKLFESVRAIENGFYEAEVFAYGPYLLGARAGAVVVEEGDCGGNVGCDGFLAQDVFACGKGESDYGWLDCDCVSLGSALVFKVDMKVLE